MSSRHINQFRPATMRALLLLAIVLVSQTKCARILVLIPVASYSHQIPLQPIWRELALRGHHVTLVTTNPMNDPSLKNLTEIDLSYTYEIYRQHNFSEFLSDDELGDLEKLDRLTTMLNDAGVYQMDHPQILDLIHNEDANFDLVIVEAQLPAMMAFSWRYDCPMIGITTLDSGMQYHLTMGNPVHPVANPDHNLPIEDTGNMSFKERLHSFVYYVGYTSKVFNSAYSNVHARLKKIFGEGVPDPKSLHDYMAILFINTHPIFHDVRPLNPNTIPIGGGIHLKEPKPLPKDIRDYLDNAKEGAIYFSLGTNVNSRMLKKLMPGVLEALGELPYRVLLKTDFELERVPKNVATHKWLPQQDILRHPNVKLFITQGGLQSLQEAVYNGVPVIGVPFMGDQVSNVNKISKKGYGLKLDKHNVTKESLKEAILEVINNPKYREKAHELSALYKDEEVPSLQRAIWWIEFVIRHKGARHLRNPVVDMPYWKYCMLDVVGFCLSVLLILVFIVYKVIKLIFKLFVRRFSSKLKVQ